MISAEVAESAAGPTGASGIACDADRLNKPRPIARAEAAKIFIRIILTFLFDVTSVRCHADTNRRDTGNAAAAHLFRRTRRFLSLCRVDVCRVDFGHNEAFAHARDLWPVTIEICDQTSHLGAADCALHRRNILELIHRFVHGRIGETPRPPRSARAEARDGVRQVDVAMPLIEGVALCTLTVARTTKMASGIGRSRDDGIAV